MSGGPLRYLRAPLEPNVDPGDKVLVISDTAADQRVWEAVMSILADLDTDPAMTLFSPRPADYLDPPAAVCEAMLRSDANVLLASTGMLHSPASFAAMAAGIPSICMDGGMPLEAFQSGAVTEDMTAMQVMKHQVGHRVFGTDAKTCRVTSRWGSDLTYSVEDRIFPPPLPGPDYDPFKVFSLADDEDRPGASLLCHLFPTGELNVPPVEGSADGVLVVDCTIHHIGRIHTPIALTVESGRITRIEGGSEARILRDYLERYGDENAYNFPAEASIGVNREAVVRGIQREDKNIFGAMHFGIGTNVDVGGTVASKIHMDGVVLEPTLEVDGEKRIEDGRFLVPIGPEL